jgi:crossover junction endodeoxyribonuclease RuvC
MPTTDRVYLGIDPGTTRIGYGVISETHGTFHALDWGILANRNSSQGSDKEQTYAALTALLKKWKPHAVGIEKLFFLNNKRSAMAVSEMRGVIMLALDTAAVKVYEFTPLQMKQRVCGHGGAPKAQVERMVRMLLGIRERITPDDAADGLGLALCCATQRIVD